MGGHRRGLFVGAVVAVVLVVTGWAIAASIKPTVSFGPTKRFSVVQTAFSAADTSMVCSDVTTLPSGPLLIESVDVHSGFGLQLYLSIPARSTGGPFYGTAVNLGVGTTQFPISGGDFHGHLSTATVIREGDVAEAPPGAPNRDESHPVRVCSEDDVNGPSYTSFWTISGQVGK